MGTKDKGGRATRKVAAKNLKQKRAEKKANRAAAKAEAKKAKAEQSQPLDSETANPPSPDS